MQRLVYISTYAKFASWWHLQKEKLKALDSVRQDQAIALRESEIVRQSQVKALKLKNKEIRMQEVLHLVQRYEIEDKVAQVSTASRI